MAALTPQPFRPDSHQSHRSFLPALFRHASEGKRRDPRQAVAAERPSARTKSRIPHCVCSAQRSLRTRRRDQESHDRFGDSDGLRRRQPGVHTATEAQDQTGARRRSFEQRGGGGQDRAEDDTAATILHRNFNTWSSVPPKYLKWLLSEAEPVSLSKYSMRAITTPGAREPPKEPMLQMLEFMAHISRDAPIGEQRQLSALAEFISRKNVECGRKLREATLPLDWASSGWFLMEWGVEKSTAHLTHRFNGDDLRIKLNVKPGTFPTLQNNYSLGKASVAYTNTSGAGERDNIQQMFVEAGLGMRLKVFDGSVKEKPEASEENKDPLVDAKYDPDDYTTPNKTPRLGACSPSGTTAAPSCMFDATATGAKAEIQQTLAAKEEVVSEKKSQASAQVKPKSHGRGGQQVAKPDAVKQESAQDSEPLALGCEDEPPFDEENFVPPEEPTGTT